MSFVVSFNRDRDFYQLPLALHERGLLTRLVTDLYLPDNGPGRGLLQGLGLGHRCRAGLPSGRVRWSLPAIFWQTLGARLPVPGLDVWARVGDSLARAALDEALRAEAHLFLYSGSAAAAFRDRRAEDRLKGLFVFHPLSGLIDEIVDRDLAEYPECAWSVATATDAHVPAARREADEEEWRHADFIVAASGFTRRSLIHAGCASEKIRVVPYGAFPHSLPPTAAPSSGRDGEGCRFLFVGQGVQRKGLHHLFRVWAEARPPAARLRVIAYVMDPGIRALAPKDVRLEGRQPRPVLDAALGEADVFVMPSLVEGFGLVYLEALAAGCYCIGSSHSGFPDLHLPDWAGACVDPGDREALARALRQAADLKASGGLDRRRIRAFAETLGWERFRRGIADAATEALAARSLPPSAPGLEGG